MTAKANKLPAIYNFVPTTFAEQMQFCELLAQSDMVPKECKGKPGEIMARLTFGAERNIPPMQALANIAVINGRPTIWGDLATALVQRSGLCAWKEEYFDTDDKGNTTAAVCKTMRKGDKNPFITKFTVDDARRAGLLGKAGPWTTHPKQQLMWKARHFNYRGNYADALGGLMTVEEAVDYPNSEPVSEEVLDRIAQNAAIEEAEVIGEARSEAVAQADEPDALDQASASPVVDEADGTPGVSEGADAPADDDEKVMISELWKACKASYLKKLTTLKALGFTTIQELRKSQVEPCAEALQNL